jgi:uncharacterized membrane protein YraQ (UPF0718 family)
MIKKIIYNIEGKWWLLFFVLILYSILAFYDFMLFKQVIDFFIKTFLQIIPVVILVFVLMFLFNLFVSTDMLVEHLGHSKKIRGWVIAITSGVISSGPIYMWFPLLSDLKEKGVRDAFLTAFLYSRAVKLPLLPVMVYYFGLTFTIILTGYILVFSIINGVIVSSFLKMKKEVKKV